MHLATLLRAAAVRQAPADVDPRLPATCSVGNLPGSVSETELRQVRGAPPLLLRTVPALLCSQAGGRPAGAPQPCSPSVPPLAAAKAGLGA